VKTKDSNTTFANGKSVFITGCSSGIGRETAVFLADRGFTVFASVRKEADAGNLRHLNLPNLVPVCPVDLTNLDNITSVVRRHKDAVGTGDHCRRRGPVEQHAARTGCAL
jgi:NAD(P)-dependent dehydrogenase (short-subunit alcohol dehydrogenase family)